MNQDGGPVGGQQGQPNPHPEWTSISTSMQAAVTVPTSPTSAQSSWTTATASLTAPSSSSTASTDSLGLSGKDRGIIIGSVIGGVAGLGIILVLVLCLLGTRKKAKKQKVAENQNRATVESRTYTGLNEAFAGVPFRRSNQSQSDKLLRGMQSPSPIYSPTTPGHLGVRDGTISRSPSPYTITPEASIRMVPSDPSLLLSYMDGAPQTPRTLGRSVSARESNKAFRYSRDLPTTPSRSLSDRVTGRFSGQVDTSRISTVDEVSLSSPKKNAESNSPQAAFKPPSPNMPRSSNQSTPTTPRFPFRQGTRDTVDTMGFPLESEYNFEPEQSPYKNLSIVAPVPRSPLHKQTGVLEQVARDGLDSTPAPSPLSNPALLAITRQSSDSSRSLSTPSPNPSMVPPPLDLKDSRNSNVVSHIFSGEMSTRESPVLGMRGPPVRISPHHQNFPPQVQGNRLTGVGRKESVRSNMTVSSAMPSVVSDGTLERLGVGPRI
jgi:hypothetical protein